MCPVTPMLGRKVLSSTWDLYLPLVPRRSPELDQSRPGKLTPSLRGDQNDVSQGFSLAHRKTRESLLNNSSETWVRIRVSRVWAQVSKFETTGAMKNGVGSQKMGRHWGISSKSRDTHSFNKTPVD